MTILNRKPYQRWSGHKINVLPLSIRDGRRVVPLNGRNGRFAADGIPNTIFHGGLAMRKNRVFMIACALFALTLGLAWSAAGAADKADANAAAAFARLKTLAGQWEAPSEKGKVTSNIELISNGTALLEKIAVPGESEMATVYYLDGKRLVLTHYCTAGNQPHMQAEAFDPASNQIRFDFAGATNLASPADGHMHSAVIKFAGPDAFTSAWTFYKDGKPAFTEPIQFHRVR